MQPVHFRWGRPNPWLYSALAFVIALGLPMLLAEDMGVRVMGLAWIAAFAWLTLLLARRTRSAEPVVSVDQEGVLDRRIADERFGWEEILRVETYDAEDMAWVGLELKDPKVSLAKARWLVRLFAPLHALFRFPRVSISMALLDGTREDLMAAICAHRPDLIVPAND